MGTHPGIYVRDNILKREGLTVKAAAERLGIGRPALSNFLNGRAALSQDMATRLQKSFGADRGRLMELQRQFDEANARPERVVVRHHIPPLFLIKARDLENWATHNVEPRSHFAVLLRKLVNSSGLVLKQVDFPGYDDTERHGWDGYVEAQGAMPWVPEGISGWEFGCTGKPSQKAEHDYEARSALPADERQTITFVFVTPHSWPSKEAWRKKKQALGHFKDVRVFDSSDLEQWLEQSLQGQIWLAEQLNRPDAGIQTLDRCWQHWSRATTPELPSELFAPAIRMYGDRYRSWLQAQPGQPFIIAADSCKEGLAFLAQLTQDGGERSTSQDLPVVFDNPEALRRMAGVSAPFIPVVWNHDTERELPSLSRTTHTIVVRPRNAIGSDPDIILDQLRHDDFVVALKAMGIEGDEAEMLERESAGSPTILRRRRSHFDAIHQPHWAEDRSTAESLVSMALIGVWHVASPADRAIISLLSGRTDDEIEKEIVSLRKLDDAPVWSIGSYRGVVSKIDALFAIRGFVTRTALQTFIKIAEIVLSERDPALDLPEKDRWAANVFDKTRQHSAALRGGIAETLVLLSVHGKTLCALTGLDIEREISSLIRKLFAPLTLDKLLSNSADLPFYAEAAPATFLSILKKDLNADKPVVLGLLKPMDHPVVGAYSRSDLFWALETLAWNPSYLAPAANMLARLATLTDAGQRDHKAETSLRGIFEPSMPQTAAPFEIRMQALETLTKNFPALGWRLCVHQFEVHSRILHVCRRPRWRNDAFGAGQQQKGKDYRAAIDKAIQFALDWPQHDERTLGDLVDRLKALHEFQETTVWDLVDRWVRTNPSDRAKAALRERIRVNAFTRRGMRKAYEITRAKSREGMRLLEPADPVVRHRWLFATQWVDESADEQESDQYDFPGRAKRVHEMRLSAMQEIWRETGLAGIRSIVAESEAPWMIGQLMAEIVTDLPEREALVRACLTADDWKSDRKFSGFLAGFLGRLPADVNKVLASAVASDPKKPDSLQVFLALPFEDATWRLLDPQPTALRERYWADVLVHCANFTAEEVNELVDRLLDVRRPVSAFHAVHLDWSKVETSRLQRLLRALPITPPEETQHFKLESYYVSAALDELERRAGISVEEMASLEFFYLDALDHTDHGIRNLEKQFALSPELFVQAIAFSYRRDDGQQDPPEYRIDDPDRRSEVAMRAHRLLARAGRIPGTDGDGAISFSALNAWITRARVACRDLGRLEIAELKIGELLARAAPARDDVWPCRPVCEALEELGTDEVREGFFVGALNRRGMHWRRQGGSEERELAAQYKAWGDRLSPEFPFVGMTLNEIAHSYEQEGTYHDDEAQIRSRLRY